MSIKICIKITLAPTCFGVITIIRERQVPNSAEDIHQQGPDNICSHTTRLTTMIYFNQIF